MNQKNNPGFDWREIVGFDYTNLFNKQDWAWEFLRVNPKYKHDYYQCEDERADVSPAKSAQGGIMINHQTPSDLKAGEWGLLNFR